MRNGILRMVGNPAAVYPTKNVFVLCREAERLPYYLVTFKTSFLDIDVLT